jgi:sec-independent protein translocase protein TatB
LPGVARTAGALFGRVQRYANQLKADIQSEVDMEEFKRIKATFYDAAKSVEQSVNQTQHELEAAAGSLKDSVAAQSGMAAGAAVETQAAAALEAPDLAALQAPDAAAQRDFWLDAAPAVAAAPPTKV